VIERWGSHGPIRNRAGEQDKTVLAGTAFIRTAGGARPAAACGPRAGPASSLPASTCRSAMGMTTAWTGAHQTRKGPGEVLD